MNIPEVAASAGAATANKVAGWGYLIVLIGWLSDATTIALIGLAITFLGGIWSFMSFLQRRAHAKAKRAEEAAEFAARRAEEAAEHAARMRSLNLEIEAREAEIRSFRGAVGDVSNG